MTKKTFAHADKHKPVLELHHRRALQKRTANFRTTEGTTRKEINSG